MCLNTTEHPTSQSLTAEISAWCLRDGKMCAVLYFCGSIGQSMPYFSVEVMVDLSGMVTWMLFVVGIWLVHGDCTVRNWSVVPESRSA